MRTETTLAVETERIIPCASTTRDALDHVFHELCQPNKQVAIPVPNWHFQLICNTLPFTFFEAPNEESLVENFEREAKKGTIYALILVNPAVPLMYTISEPAARLLDETACRYGVDIVIDDILRGLDEPGQRDSIARFFTRPYVVEGFSKRYGDEPLGDVSYILAPDAPSAKKMKMSVTSTPEYETGRYVRGSLLQLAYHNATASALAELKRRNEAFDNGLHLFAPPETTVVRASPCAITSLVRLPEHCRYTGTELEKELKGEMVVAGMGSFLPDGHRRQYDKIRDMKALRITVGPMDEQMVYQGARELGMRISMATPM
ncbi:MAG: hypothetical protein Q7R76_04700 [Candidatus Woesearchaeota archaeon]|nr:hypothetical protein [Candidatus Woesearchaeota archaeon]